MKIKKIVKLFQGEKLPESEKQLFQNEISEINNNRIRIVTGFMVFLFLSLLILDYFNFKNGLWQLQTAYKLIGIVHGSALIFVLLISMYFFFENPTGKNPAKTQKLLLSIIIIIMFLIHISVISYCDILISGSAAAYMGALFAVAAFFILPPACSLAVFTCSLIFMTALILTASKQTGTIMSIQLINVTIYSVFAYILSGILYRYQKQDFIHRLKIQRQTRELEQIAMKDPLTDIMNRRFFLTEMHKDIARAHRYGHELSLCILDIDHFKNINDQYGHITGDKVLINLCSLIKKNIRTNDVFARWGGEEFVLLSLDTDADMMASVCEKLRKLILDNSEKDIPSISASFGVTSYHTGDSIENMIQRADTALYEAKSNGRNCIRLSV